MSNETRPTSVSIVVVLTWISAIMALIQGALYLFKYQPFIESTGLDNSLVRITGIIWIIVGLVMAFAASRLGHGSKVMRFLVSAVMVFRIIGGGLEIANGGGAARLAGALAIAFAGATLALLWNSKANAFFNR